VRYSRFVKSARVVLCVLLLAPAGAIAGELELGLFVGRAIPTYEQTFDYNPGAFLPPTPLPGLSLAQQGSFGLTARGGLAAGGSLAFFPADFMGIEARLDTVNIKVDATGVRYVATLSVAPLPPFTTSLDLPPGVVQVDRLTPLSLGLKLQTPRRARGFVSAGISYLPKTAATVTQSLAIGLDGFSAPISVKQARIRAAALPGDRQGRWGLTAGIGLQVPMGSRVWLEAEARAFRFRTQSVGWELVETAGVPFVDDLLENAVSRLDSVDFKPTFYQATAGLAFRF
jgi:hypothetical protein